MENAVALGGARGWHRLFCLNGLQDSDLPPYGCAVQSHRVRFQPPRREYSLDTGESLKNLRSPRRYSFLAFCCSEAYS